MSSTTEHPPAEHSSQERSSQERSSPERKEPTFLFTEKYVAEKSEIARRFLGTRERLNASVDKANNFLVKRFYNVDHNTYLEGALPAKTKELMGLVASACLRVEPLRPPQHCPECVGWPGRSDVAHRIQAGNHA